MVGKQRVCELLRRLSCYLPDRVRNLPLLQEHPFHLNILIRLPEGFDVLLRGGVADADHYTAVLFGKRKNLPFLQVLSVILFKRIRVVKLPKHRCRNERHMHNVGKRLHHFLFGNVTVADQIGPELLPVLAVEFLKRLITAFRCNISLNDQRVTEQTAVAAQLVLREEIVVRLGPFYFLLRLLLMLLIHDLIRFLIPEELHLKRPEGRREIDDVSVNQPDREQRRQQTAEEHASKTVHLIERVSAENLTDDHHRKHRDCHIVNRRIFRIERRQTRKQRRDAVYGRNIAEERNQVYDFHLRVLIEGVPSEK